MQTVSFYRSFTCQNIPLRFPSPKEQQKAKSATGRTEIKAMPQELRCFFPGLMSCREGLQSWQDPSSGHPSAAQEQPRGGEDPAPPEGEVSVPWARFDLQSQGNARAFERNLQAKGKAWGGKNWNNYQRSLFSTAFSSTYVLLFPRDTDNAIQMLLWLSL